MNILMVNKFFFRKGGSETCFFNTMRLLESRGHRTVPFAMSNPQNEKCAYSGYFVSEVDLSNQGAITNRLKATQKVLYSVEARKKLGRLLTDEPVDIAHLHNIYHQLSPSIITELKSRDIPIVMTLHDYKMVCPTYSLLDTKGICERCAGRRYWQVLAGSCGRGFSERVLLATEMYLHHKVFSFFSLVDIFISPSRFLKEKIHQMGFKGKIEVLPNFTRLMLNDFRNTIEHKVVYFGRLSQEKGLYTLLRASRGLPCEICIIGDGPLRAKLEARAANEQLNNVHFLGHLSDDLLHKEIDSGQAVIVPSEWYENNPLSIIEAFALGKPVIGSRIGGIPELVRDGETGLTFEPGNTNDLREKITWLIERPQEIIRMGKNARRLVEEELNPNKHYEELMAIYQRAIEKSPKH